MFSDRIEQRQCTGCGWIYPATFKAPVCKFCKAPVRAIKFKPVPGNCANCGAYVEDIYHNRGKLCNKCYYKKVYADKKARPNFEETRNKNRMKHYYVTQANADRQYTDWLSNIKDIKMHTLTEDEWMKACMHFGGCAFCGAASIDTRQYFIKFKEGGKYNACNIVPACDLCATDLKKNPNPFRYMDKQLNESKSIYRGQNRERLKRIVDYLQCIIEEAKNEPEGTNGSL